MKYIVSNAKMTLGGWPRVAHCMRGARDTEVDGPGFLPPFLLPPPLVNSSSLALNLMAPSSKKLSLTSPREAGCFVRSFQRTVLFPEPSCQALMSLGMMSGAPFWPGGSPEYIVFPVHPTVLNKINIVRNV